MIKNNTYPSVIWLTAVVSTDVKACFAIMRHAKCHGKSGWALEEMPNQ